MSLLLAVDVGNTSTDLGAFQGEKLVARWSVSTLRGRSVDEYGVLIQNLFAARGLRPEAIQALVVACVVPPLESTLAEVAARYLPVPPLFVAPGIRPGMPVLVDNPQEVGADRIVNGVAAFARFQRSVIVAGSGTATGLAWRIIEAGNRLQIPRMFAALLLLAASGIAIFYGLALLEHLLLRKWHESVVSKEQ